jgi:Uma2 family endonuclease
MTTAPRRPRVDPSGPSAPKRTPQGAVILDRPATRADLNSLPRTYRGEILAGTLYAFPRPRARHQRAGGTLYQDLCGPFDRGRGGPGGWWILIEPGVELPGEDEFSPDVAGWRRERMPHLPRKGAIQTVPDWICEVLSPRTRSYDHVTKRRYYAAIGVSYLWYVDPFARTLTASKLEGGRWVELGAWQDDETVRTEPFDAVEVNLSPLWEGFDDEDEEEGSGEESPSPPSTTV